MRKAVWLLVVFALVATAFGCKGKEGTESTEGKAVQKSALPGTDHDKELVLNYLKGIQKGDKNMMYAATNLTPALVDACKDKLIHQAKNKLTDVQRKSCEKELEISGEIDFYSLKVRKNLPKTSSFQVMKSEVKKATDDSRDTEHYIKITYSDPAEALKDKNGKPIKEMVIPLEQTTQWVDGRWIQEFKFGAKDDFRILSSF